MLHNESKPDILDLLGKIQEATTSDVDEERGSFKKGDKVAYNMLGGSLSNSDLIKTLGVDEHGIRVQHDGAVAKIVEAMGEEVSRYSLQFEDGFVINDVAVSEVKVIAEAKLETFEEGDTVQITHKRDTGYKIPGFAEGIVRRKLENDRFLVYFEWSMSGKPLSQLANLAYDDIEKISESKTNEAEDATQTMKPQEKPDLSAEDLHMEDYSEEDLNKPEAKVKSKSEKSGDAIRAVEDDELEQKEDKVEKSKNESKVVEGNGVDEAVETKDELKDKVVSAYKKYRENGKSREEAVQRAVKDFDEVDAPEIRKILDIAGVTEKESKFQFMKKQEPLWLCNECCKTFRSDECSCIFCESIDADKIGEGYGDLAGSTKEVFQVTWTEDGKEESTRMMAFDKDDAKREVERNPNKKVTKVEGPIKSAEKENDAPFEQASEGSELQESVSELVGETPGIDIEDQKILNWAIEKNIVSNEWPSEEAMIDQLSAAEEKGGVVAGEGAKDLDGLDLGETQAVYLKYILLPKATTAYAKSVSESIQEGIPKAGKTYYIIQTTGRGWPEGDYKVVDVQFLRCARGDLAKQFRVEGDNKNWWLAEFYHFKEIDEVEEKKIPSKLITKLVAFAKEHGMTLVELEAALAEEIDKKTDESKVQEQEDDTFITIGKGLEKEDAEKLALEKDGQVITDEDDESKFAVIIKGE